MALNCSPVFYSRFLYRYQVKIGHFPSDHEGGDFFRPKGHNLEYLKEDH